MCSALSIVRCLRLEVLNAGAVRRLQRIERAHPTLLSNVSLAWQQLGVLPVEAGETVTPWVEPPGAASAAATVEPETGAHHVGPPLSNGA
jgi:hypothetical protein